MENFKLSVNNIDYFVNEEKKCVTCRVNYVLKAADETLLLLFGADCLVDNCDFGEAVATARVHADDVFDVETGKKVARAKAESLAYRQVVNYLDNITEVYSRKFMRPALMFIEKAEKVIDHNDEYLEQF